MRVAIIGNSGSGKSTLARQLADTQSVTPLELDTMVWEPGQVGVPRNEDAVAAELRAFCSSHDRWVIEGCYARLAGDALRESPILIFADPGVDACLANAHTRPWEPHKFHSPDTQQEMLPFLLEWIREYYTRDGDLSQRAHAALFDGYQGPKYRLTGPSDETFVKTLAARWCAHDVERLSARFTQCTVPGKEWTHAAHLAVGTWHVDRFGREEALARLRVGIRRLNESHGGVNSATNGYHETITAAYVELLAQFLARRPAGMPLPHRVAALLETPLAGTRALSAFYTTGRLMSTTARARWVEPDVAPLDLAALSGTDG